MSDDSQAMRPTAEKRVYADTGDGGRVEVCGPGAWRLGDAILAVIEGRAAIVPADLLQPQHWLWHPAKETAK